MSWMDEARPAPSGSTACGKSTVPRRGRIARMSGTGCSVPRRSSIIVSCVSLSEQIDRTQLSRGGAHQRFARLPRDAGRAVAAVVPNVADEVLDLLLHIDHPASHL